MTHIGLIGLGTMGENLVKNFISHGETVVVWNRTFAKSEELAQLCGPDRVIPCETIEMMVKELRSDSQKIHIFLLVPAGAVTDDIAHRLFSLLSSGDAIWDLGNAHWDTTIAHQSEALKHGIHWIGCGISGGSEGARLGPSLMPGGDEDTIRGMLPILEKIAAKDFSGKPCVTYVGREAAGNFVKMVHNGIEYAIMQGIAEIYDLVRFSGMSQSGIHDIFQTLNTGLLKSFLLDITVDILSTRDTDGSDLLPKISDKAGSKGTGGWTVEAALKLGVPIPSISEALFARWMSSKNYHCLFSRMKNEEGRMKNEGMINIQTELLKNSLELVYFASYIQGVELILAAEKYWNWGIIIDDVLRIWQGGCIIRSEMLAALPDFYHQADHDLSSDLSTLLRDTKTLLDQSHTPIPVLSSAYNYFITLQSHSLPTNLIQAMRDSFGAHGVRRIGSEQSESFEWK